MENFTPRELSVAFDADRVWHKPSLFQQKSRQLWIELNELKKPEVYPSPCATPTRTPSNRLALLDLNYLERETGYGPELPVSELNVQSSYDDEPWLFPEVSAAYRKLKSAVGKTRIIHSVAVAPWICEEYPVLARNCQNFDFDVSSCPEVCLLPYQLFELKDLQEVELALRIKCCQKLWNNRNSPQSADKPAKVVSPCKSANCYAKHLGNKKGCNPSSNSKQESAAVTPQPSKSNPELSQSSSLPPFTRATPWDKPPLYPCWRREDSLNADYGKEITGLSKLIGYQRWVRHQYEDSFDGPVQPAVGERPRNRSAPSLPLGEDPLLPFNRPVRSHLSDSWNKGVKHV